MAQEAMQEIDMDVFSRRIGPYFSWLESKIESGWVQSDHVTKDVLKEAKYLATTMRARFILGVAKPDFVKEVERTLELFELACEAFPSESDEIETKIKHFTKGISEELGPDFVPANKEFEQVVEAEPEISQDVVVKVEIPEQKVKSEHKVKSEPKKVHVSKSVEKTKPVKKIKAKKSVKKIKQVVSEDKPVVKSEVKDKPKKSKKFSLISWLKEAFYGEDLD